MGDRLVQAKAAVKDDPVLAWVAVGTDNVLRSVRLEGPISKEAENKTILPLASQIRFAILES